MANPLKAAGGDGPLSEARGLQLHATPIEYFPPPVGNADKRIARFYIAQAVILSAICSAWTLSNYNAGSNAQHIFALLSLIVTAALCLGFLGEVICYREDYRTNLLEKMLQRGHGFGLVHAACATTGVFSCCVAAVNVYEGANDWLYGLSLLVIVLNWAFWFFCTPVVAMPLAVYSTLSASQRKVVDAGQAATTYLLRKSYLLDT